MVTRGRRRRGACFILIHNQGDNKNKPPFLTGSKLPGHPLTCRTHAGDWVHVGLELYILTGPISSKKERVGYLNDDASSCSVFPQARSVVK
jgi:hypothetical protein